MVAPGTINFSPANYWGSIGMGGYGYAFSDGTSWACLNAGAFCGAGNTAPMSSSVWGAGIGVNLNQMPGGTTPGNFAVPTGAMGISYTLSSLPSGTVYLMIDDNGPMNNYYATITSAAATVPWSAFQSKPWQLDASAGLSGPPMAATHIQFQLSAGAAATPFAFCVTSLKFM
jgi:hypothetical protein